MFRIKILEEAVVFLLEKIADTVGQFGIPGKFGIAIIIITILMRIVVFPLTLKQEKSMKKMRDLQPELEKIKEKGVIIAEVFLDVGLGTFRPVQTENILEHKMHSEKYKVPEETVKIVNDAKKKGNRVIAVGTTSVRTLESSINEEGKLVSGESETSIFIYGDYKFKIVDAIITNFHLPKSTLIMLIAAFGGKKFVFDAYHEAIREKYRFYSFGDSMFIY